MMSCHVLPGFRAKCYGRFWDSDPKPSHSIFSVPSDAESESLGYRRGIFRLVLAFVISSRVGNQMSGRNPGVLGSARNCATTSSKAREL